MAEQGPVMQGSGRSDSRVVRVVGGVVTLVTVVGFVAFGWSFADPSGTRPAVLGVVAAVVAVGWTLYDRTTGE